jgi:hypothetical protein
MQASTSLFGVDWMEMEGKLAKSGLLAHSTKDHDKKVEREANLETLNLDRLSSDKKYERQTADKNYDLVNKAKTDNDSDKPFEPGESIV